MCIEVLSLLRIKNRGVKGVHTTQAEGRKQKGTEKVANR
jgi:hypothetical protein